MALQMITVKPSLWMNSDLFPHQGFFCPQLGAQDELLSVPWLNLQVVLQKTDSYRLDMSHLKNFSVLRVSVGLLEEVEGRRTSSSQPPALRSTGGHQHPVQPRTLAGILALPKT